MNIFFQLVMVLLLSKPLSPIPSLNVLLFHSNKTKYNKKTIFLTLLFTKASTLPELLPPFLTQALLFSTIIQIINIKKVDALYHRCFYRSPQLCHSSAHNCANYNKFKDVQTCYVLSQGTNRNGNSITFSLSHSFNLYLSSKSTSYMV